MKRSGMSDSCRTHNYRQQLDLAMSILLAAPIFGSLGKIGRRWTARSLARAMVLMIWNEASSLTGQFHAIAHLLPRPVRRCSYQGLIKCSLRWSPRILRRLGPYWRRCVLELAGPHESTGGWIAIAVDGSKIDLPRTTANEKAFGVSGKKNGGPQAFLCSIIHLATGLPWAWKIGRAMTSERHLLRQMIPLLPKHGLLVADAGFTGYDLWSEIIDSGRSILIRAGANVRLIKPRGCVIREHDGVVYLWPDIAAKQGRPPLILRTIYVQDGRRQMCLLTNVLDTARLSDQQAMKFYCMRWSIEVWFRGLKQTLGKRKMRSEAPAQAALELRWAIQATALLGLVTAQAQAEAGKDPRRLSLAQALKSIRTLLLHSTRRCRPWHLRKRLASAVIDSYKRRSSKKARGWPHKKCDPSPGLPKLREATQSQMVMVQSFVNQKHAA